MTITENIRAIVERVKNLGPEWHHTASKLEDAARAAEDARAHRLAFLENCLTQTTDRLARLKEQIRTLPEQIAKWEAERARLESQTGIDLLRAVVAETPTSGEPVYTAKPPGQVLVNGKPEDPFVPGLPPLRLREVWAEWEDKEGDVATFKGERYRYSSWPSSDADQLIGDGSEWSSQYPLRPHGKTRAEVEAMADAAERKPALLDLRGLKVGTTVLFEADAIGGAGGGVVKKGYSVAIKAMSGAGVLVTWHDGLWERWIAPLQPARVVEVPR